MKRILVTGATGNVGMEVIRFLTKSKTKFKVVAGVRDVAKSAPILAQFEHIDLVSFDFEKPDTFHTALKNVDGVFLLRPPHISNVDLYFKPLIQAFVSNNIREIVFLSVQGAEKSTVIPHNKIEKLIDEAAIPHVFLRPSYFMQNLTTTLLIDIQQKRKITLPAGKAKFNWIDIENIGEITAILFDRFIEFRNQAIELTGYENLSFETVAKLINTQIDEVITFENTNPLRFFRIKKKEGLATGLILVMTLLHFLPRFQPEPQISNFYEKLTGKKPTTLNAFIKREREKFQRR